MPATGKESLIVALDVPTVNDALRIVETLENVSFFKVGLQLFMTGDLRRLLEALRQKELFVDLKVPGDIANTIGSVVEFCVDMRVKFLTLSESMPLAAIRAAAASRSGRGSQNPKFLTVPFLSSLDRSDLQQLTGDDDLPTYILSRAHAALEAGCDGVVASGQEIRLCRQAFPSTIIVSPGIRPSGSSSDDHKRFTTPTDAIRLGADYLVVGRPILRSDNPSKTADSIIAEIDRAMTEKASSQSGHGATSPSSAITRLAASAARQ